MKLICAALLSVIATTSLAAEDTMIYSKAFAAAMVSAVCVGKTQPTSKIGSVGTVRQVYTASTDDLHRCLYFSEVANSDCVKAGNCKSYESWTQANPAISPALPRETFLDAIAERMTDALTQAN